MTPYRTLRYLIWWIGCFVLIAGVIDAADRPEMRDAALGQKSRARLAVLRHRVAHLQQEVRELEELLDDRSKILIRIEFFEVDAAEARKAGLPVAERADRTAIQPVAAEALPQTEPCGLLSPDEATAIIERLTAQGSLRTLANPCLHTVDGRTAQILSGGEFPWLQPVKPVGVRVEWKDFGMRAEVTPTIRENGSVRVSFDVSFSERDFSTAVEAGITIPGLTTRQMTSTVDMNFDETFMMCGLTSGKQRVSQQVIPITKKVPYVSRLFKQVSAEEPTKESALVVFVTPSLVPRDTPADPPRLRFPVD